MSDPRDMWAKLSYARKIGLLAICFPERSVYILKYEATLAWNKLLPSTQKEVEREMCQRREFYARAAAGEGSAPK